MITLTHGLSYIDLEFLGVPRVIAAAVLQSAGGVAVIDPGPSTTLEHLRAALGSAGITIADVQALVLTHIHLDHAGATGTLVHENPRVRVYVHERGAPHLADPGKLLASAARLYGADMDRLWGEVRPVPRENVVALAGGEHVDVGGRKLEVMYTPGHASHHVSYFNRDSGIAFVGDTAGIKLRDGGYVFPPTPPPDIDLELWRDSVGRIAGWRPSTLFLTHFGPVMSTDEHLSELGEHLERVAALARQSLEMQTEDDAREQWFLKQVRRELRQRMTEADTHAYDVAGRFDLSWRGLARYWRKAGQSGR
jgi:glyoxylase-like metal-dependent hydrolase (beta-lactamase superfamily II)